jgi:hypothetical protein
MGRRRGRPGGFRSAESDKVTTLAAAVRRLAAGSLRRGAAQVIVKLWDLPQKLIFELSDDTAIADVMIGRRAPMGDDLDGLWFANQLCDLVQVRSTSSWTTVRLYAWK